MSISLNDIIDYGTCKFKVVKYATSEDIGNLRSDVNDKFDLNNDWCYIYPNNGTEQNPANITTGSKYIETNPFPNYFVGMRIELYDSTIGWYQVNHIDYYSGSTYHGIEIYQYNSNIVIRTGNAPYLAHPSDTEVSTTNKISKCRVKVWKIGKI